MQVHWNPATAIERREFFTGQTDAELHRKMDDRRATLESSGYVFVKRTRIGRNATCPCGSGRKFKKCCIGKADTAGVVGPQAAGQSG
jgi:uncharacterized protein YchJ